MAENQTTRRLVAQQEEDGISRNVLVWLNSYTDLPVDVIRHELLNADETGMILSVIPGTYITQRYIYGGHRAQYDFAVIYRFKPGNSIDKRLKAEAELNAFADWLTDNKPNLGDNISVVSVQQITRAAMTVAHENGDEDYQFSMRITYEII